MSNILILQNKVQGVSSYITQLEKFIPIGSELQSCSYEGIKIIFNNNPKLANIVTIHGNPLSYWDVLYIKNAKRHPEVAKTIALYMAYIGHTVFDKAMLSETYGAKLFQYMKMYLNNIQFPPTIYLSRDILPDAFQTIVAAVGIPFVFKDIAADKGKNNYLIHTEDEFLHILTEHITEEFIAQKFIPNSCDYRFLVLGGSIANIKKRSRVDANEHRNNTSLGGMQEFVAPAQFEKDILAMVEKSAGIFSIDIAGVDCVISDEDKKPYILEVNKAPQMPTDIQASSLVQYLLKV